jgi:4-diphosphocytidyl-2-C-methyl-D-erythritol kinase
MFLRKANSKWIVRTPAKLNVYLSIQGRRPDGYHELHTLMLPIAIFDTLSFEPLHAEGTSPRGIQFQLLAVGGRPERVRPGGTPGGVREVPDDGTNLVVRALSALRQYAGCKSGANVTLVKRIPAGAGLGGGSSDAAAALVAANKAWGLALAQHELAQVASTLGSDVPFFLTCRPAVCTGRGEVVTPLEKGGRLHMVLVTPPERLASAEVYGALETTGWTVPAPDHTARFERLLTAIRRGDVGALGRLFYNGLERAALSLQPGLARVKKSLERISDAGGLMTGSGSSFFCLCRTARHARRGAAYLNSLGLSSAISVASCG